MPELSIFHFLVVFMLVAAITFAIKQARKPKQSLKGNLVCSECGAPIRSDVEICPFCGVRQR